MVLVFKKLVNSVSFDSQRANLTKNLLCLCSEDDARQSKNQLDYWPSVELRAGSGIWSFQRTFPCSVYFALYLLNRPRSRKILDASRNNRYKRVRK